MSISLDVSSLPPGVGEDAIHSVACKIDFDGPAKVADYFTSGIRETALKTDGSAKTFEAAFRGRPMQGQNIPVPEGYTGIVMRESQKPFSEDEEREFRITHKFKEFTHWNLDLEPSKNDKIHQALEWIEIAKVIHGSDEGGS